METLTHLSALAAVASVICGILAIINASRRYDAKHLGASASTKAHNPIDGTSAHGHG